MPNAETNYPCVETRYGFDWGPASVQRVVSDPKAGVVISISSAKGKTVYVRVTPSGLTRVSTDPRVIK